MVFVGPDPKNPYIRLDQEIFYTWHHTVTKVWANSVLFHGVPRGTSGIARNCLRLKIRAIAGYSTEPGTITSYSWEYSQV